NVLITADGHAKVADFGVAKAIGEVALTELHTTTGQVIGAPASMAAAPGSSRPVTPDAGLGALALLAHEPPPARRPLPECSTPPAAAPGTGCGGKRPRTSPAAPKSCARRRLARPTETPSSLRWLLVT